MAHIVVDARRIRSSTGFYTKHLLRGLEKLNTKHKFTIVVLEKEKDYYKPEAKNFSVVTTTADHYTFAEQLQLPFLLYRLKPDVVHFTMPQQPLLWFGKRVTTVHDTTLIRYENVDQNIVLYKIRKFIFFLLLRNVIARSKAVVSPTNYVRGDLDEWTHHKYSDHLRVTPISRDVITDKPEPIKALVGKRFLFFVGNAFPYKNVDKVILAFEKLKVSHPDLHLALAGKKDFFYEQLEQMVQEREIKDVHILGFVSDGEKQWLMENTSCYVVASLSEGFHMPIHEAMSAGSPVVSSNATCLPEVGGDAALYFSPNDVDECMAQVERVLTDKKLRETMIKKGKAHIKGFSWEKATKTTYDAYLFALGKR